MDHRGVSVNEIRIQPFVCVFVTVASLLVLTESQWPQFCLQLKDDAEVRLLRHSRDMVSAPKLPERPWANA